MGDDIAEVPELLFLPEGTTLYPGECGFVLPDGRYMRMYASGVRLELLDGSAAGGEDDTVRPQLYAHRCRVDGTPHRDSSHRDVSYVIATNVEVILPETLSAMDDEGLIALSHLIMRRIVELELKIDVEDGDKLADLADLVEGELYAHEIDLTTAGPYGGEPLP
jgi:hypothetical protein